MKNTQANMYAIHSLREDLRLRAADLANRLSRSVGRLTSCDALPCLEYGEEVSREHMLAEQLLYIQHCRNALEKCIAQGGAVLRYRWADGSSTQTRFRKVSPGGVKVSGLLPRSQ